MIYTAPCVRFLMRADRLRGEVGGGGLALEIESFVGPCEIARADRRVPFGATWAGGPVRHSYVAVDFIPQSWIYEFGYRRNCRARPSPNV
jgi:hypothetical protein